MDCLTIEDGVEVIGLLVRVLWLFLPSLRACIYNAMGGNLF